jgi:hypothetical protein
MEFDPNVWAVYTTVIELPFLQWINTSLWTKKHDERGCGLADEYYANLSCDGHMAVFNK